MRTVSIFANGNNQAVRIPKDMEFSNLKELEIFREGDSLILRPTRPDWLSFAELDKVDDDFLVERPDVMSDEGRFEWL
ncbi:MAG: type II toxin-antitoxin system VapB family antitoxin [Thiothrix litoralis]|jgi:antitoxin VapB|uniref:type II toxin-antitoxin system VapB family antitoxin n=1 Tax=Thiothrix litoralis TaxID=2891210 RepID=UPI003C71CB04